MRKKITLDGSNLSIENLYRIAIGESPVSLSRSALKKVEKTRKFIEEFIQKDIPIYGVTTGFGKLSNKKIDMDSLGELQKNLVRSHAAGVGDPFSEEEVRAAMAVRINVLLKGFSGVRPIVIETLAEMLNRGVIPYIPEKGSVGASGDLAPSAHLSLVLIGEGKAFYRGELLDGKKALDEAGIKPLDLEAKEGLALLNGTQFMAGIGSYYLFEISNLFRVANITAALSNDVLLGTDKHFDKKIQGVRPHRGQSLVAATILKYLNESELRKSHINCDRVQDAYALRCIPQVYGAVFDTKEYAKSVFEIEINSATDNPLIFPEAGEVISGGNFHGEPVAFVLDFLSIALSGMGAMIERRIERMVNPDLSEGLPPFLVKNPGLNSGFMIAHVTAAALVNQNKIYSHPSSVDSIPTSANKEDHLSMGMNGLLKLREIFKNLKYLVAIELLAGCQALDFRRPYKTSPFLEDIYAKVRETVPFMEKDRNISEDILKVMNLIDERVI